jgi:hypothetical protein
MNPHPRNMRLKAFDPHRKDFVCKHEADVVPPIDPEAEQWNRQALALTTPHLWYEQRDYVKAVQLWTAAAQRKHWKAMLNLADAYAHGRGVQEDTEKGVQIIEEAMRLRIPAAFDLMGTYHQRGLGVVQDADRAWAFWQLAADMGSPNAMGYIGDKLTGNRDEPRQGFWGNRPIGLAMLRCGVAQGNGDAARSLASELRFDKKYDEALATLQAGVRFGGARCAGALFLYFDEGDPVVGGIKDPARAQRYLVLIDALDFDPDLRLPNLDKVLPLPPAPLPTWDGDKHTLIDAAKGLVPTPGPVAPPATAASQRTGRAHIPQGYALPERPEHPQPPAYETTSADAGGYWLAQLLHPSTEGHHSWNAEQVPIRYERGEPFDRSRPGLSDDDGRILFHYLGEPVSVPTPEPFEDPRVAQRIARYADPPRPIVSVAGNQAAPHSGVWLGRVPNEHPAAMVFNHWLRQTYATRGNPFPDPRTAQLDIAPSAITWHWWGEANAMRGDSCYITVGEKVCDNGSTRRTAADES